MVLEVDATARELVVWQHKGVVKRVAIKGLSQRLLAFDEFVDQLATEARAQWRRARSAACAQRRHPWASG